MSVLDDAWTALCAVRSEAVASERKATVTWLRERERECLQNADDIGHVEGRLTRASLLGSAEAMRHAAERIGAGVHVVGEGQS